MINRLPCLTVDQPFVPGANGLSLSAALSRLINEPEEQTLTLTKRKTGEGFHLEIVLTKGASNV